MPDFLITSPDGNKYRVTAPEGKTEQDALAYVKQNHEKLQALPTTGGTEYGAEDTTPFIQPGSRQEAIRAPLGSSERAAAPDTKTAFKQREALEKDMLAKGMKREDFKNNPEWVAATKAQGRGVTAQREDITRTVAGAEAGAPLAKLAIKGVGKIAEGVTKPITRALTKAPEEAARKAAQETEQLRSQAVKEAERAAVGSESQAATVEQQVQQRAEAVQAERDRVARTAEDTAKTLDKNINEGFKNIERMRYERTKASAPGKKPELPQYLRGSKLEKDVPATTRTEGARGPNEREAARAKLPGLSGAMDQSFRRLKDQISDHASRLYAMATKVSGDAPINVAPLREAVSVFVESMPEDIKLSIPPLIRNLQHSDVETMTLQQLQTLRTTLRDFAYTPKFTRSLRDGPYAHLAGVTNKILHNSENPLAVRQGVRIIDSGDKFYAKHMKQFQSETMLKIAKDVEDGLPMTAQKIAEVVGPDGEAGTLKRIVQIGGEPIRVQLRNADFQNIMSSARKLGTKEIDAKKLLSELVSRQENGTLHALYGARSSEILDLARRLAARGGAISTTELKPGNFRLMLQHANDLAKRLPELDKQAAGAEKLRAQAAASAAKRSAESPNARVVESKLVPKKGTDAASLEEPKPLPKAEAYREGADAFKMFAERLKAVSPEKVPTEARSLATQLRKDRLITSKEYEGYIEKISKIADSYEKSKKALADRQKAVRAIQHLTRTLVYLGGGFGAYRLSGHLFGP